MFGKSALIRSFLLPTALIASVVSAGQFGTQSQQGHQESTPAALPSFDNVGALSDVIVELKDKPTLLEYGQYVRRQSEARATAVDGRVAGQSEIKAYRADLASKKEVVLSAISAVVQPGSTVKRFDLVSNSIIIANSDVEKVKVAVQSNPLAARLVKQVAPSEVVAANLTESVSQIGAPSLWGLTSGSGDPLNGTGMRIGILDTGVDYTHPDLGGCFGANCKVVGGYDFVDQDADPMDIYSGHGTSVAAIAAGVGSYKDEAGNVKPLLGVAPGAKLYAYRVLGHEAEKIGERIEATGSAANILSGIERCVDPDGDGNFSDRLDVCNLSFNAKGTPDSPLSTAVDAATAAGVVMVVSAGNRDDEEDPFVTFGSPANSRTAITVGASCKTGDTSALCPDGMYRSTNKGPVLGYPEILKPDVVAPGVAICSALGRNDVGDSADCLDANHIVRSGTSFAAPHVAGLAALLRQAYPSASPELIKTMISGGATDLGVGRILQGFGLVNAYESYLKLQGQSSVATLTGLPIKLESDPALGVVSESKVVTITNKSNEQRVFTPSLLNATSGLTASFVPAQVSLDAGESADVTVNFTANGAQLPSGTLIQGRVSFASGSDIVSGWVYGVVGSRFVANPSTLDYGLIDGSSDTPSWNASRSVVITNRSSQSDLVLSVAVDFDDETDWSGHYKGLRSNLPSDTITVPAGEQFDLSVVLEATGQKLPNREYRGFINITSALQTVSVPFTVFKGWRVEFNYGSEGVKPDYVVLHNSETKFLEDYIGNKKRYESFPKASDVSATINVATASTWYVDAHYPDAVVFKSNITLTEPTTVIDLRDSEANIRIGTNATRPNGNEPTSGYAITGISQNGITVVSRASTIAKAKTGFRVNKFTSDIVFSAAYVETNESDFYVWQYFNRGTGATGDVTLQQGEFVTKYINAPQNVDPEDSTKVSLFAKASIVRSFPGVTATTKGYGYSVRSNADIKLEKGTIGRLYASKNTAVDPKNKDFVLQPNFGLMALPGSYVAADGPIEEFYVLNDVMLIGQDESYAMYPWHDFGLYDNNAYRAVIRPDTSDMISLGAGPEFPGHEWEIWPAYNPKFGDGTNGYAFEGGSQRYVLLQRTMSYEFYKNGSLIKSGDRDLERGLDENNSQLGGPLSDGSAYKLVTTFKQMIGGKELPSKAETNFVHTSARDDQSPPALQRLAIVANDLVQNVIDPSVKNVLAFTLDPVNWINDREDAIQTVSAEYSANGEDWSDLEVDTVTPTHFTAEILLDPKVEIHHLRIRATDLVGSEFTYTFQIPTGTAVTRSSLPATPTPTPTWTNTPLPAATPTHTPEPTATNTPVPLPPAPPSSDGPVRLSAAKAVVKNRSVEMRISSLQQSPELINAMMSNRTLRSGATGRPDQNKQSDPTTMQAQCSIRLKSERSRLSRSFNVTYSKGAVVKFSRMKPGMYSADYNCKVGMGKLKAITFTSDGTEFLVK